jgi:hypothetical protein
VSPEILAALIGAVSTLAAAIIAVIWGTRRSVEHGTVSTPPATRLRKYRYDVFLSSPLAGFGSDDEIALYHDRITQIVDLLENSLGFTVYWAGRGIQKRIDFEAADLSAIVDVNAVIDSRHFLMLYPAGIVSSVLFEAGIALRNCQTSIYFVSKRENLPFLMTEASQAFPNVRIYEGVIPDDLLALLRKHGKSFFDPTIAV